MWDSWAASFAKWAPRAWAQEEITWGSFCIPESSTGALPGDISELAVIELGCGTAYISAWLARRGARVVGIDNTPKQLETAHQMQEQFGLDFPLHLGSAEDLPSPNDSFGLAISEYGASIWCDPYAWIPEAARLLRPGGHLIFLCNGIVSEDAYYRMERFSGWFYPRLPLLTGTQASGLLAEFNNGVLTITVDKPVVETAKPTRVDIH